MSFKPKKPKMPKAKSMKPKGIKKPEMPKVPGMKSPLAGLKMK
jgi:hypothetical protein